MVGSLLQSRSQKNNLLGVALDLRSLRLTTILVVDVFWAQV